MNDSELNAFLKILFDENEFVWLGSSYLGQKFSKSIAEVYSLKQSVPTKDGYFIGLNPATDVGLSHGKNSIKIYRNLLFEFDNIALDKQYKLLNKIDFPYSTLVYSGGKSLHAVISLEQPVQDELEYKELHEQLRFALSGLADSQTCKPTVFTRLPGFERESLKGVRIQAAVDIRGRVSKDTLDKFLLPTQKEYQFKKSLQNYIKGKKTITNFRVKTETTSGTVINILESYVFNNEYRELSNGQFQLQCPLCAIDGRDSDMNHLSINSEQGLWHCFAGCSGPEVFSCMKKYLKNKRSNDQDD